MKAVKQYPKLLLLLFSAIQPNLCIFSNDYFSFIEQCHKWKLIDFESFKTINNRDQDTVSRERREIRKYNPQSEGRQLGLKFFTQGYDQMLTKAVNKQKAKAKTSEEEKIHEEKLQSILARKNILSLNEVNFIFDFLYEMCQNAQKLEQNAVSLGTHLLNDFYIKSAKQFDKSIIHGKNVSAELMALNFEIRSKKFIEDSAIVQNVHDPRDVLF